jgi:hypothetical protein
VEARVPDTFQLGIILRFSGFRSHRIFSKLRIINTLEYSDSPAATIIHSGIPTEQWKLPLRRIARAD